MSKGYAVELNNKFAWTEDSVLVFTTHGCLIILLGEYRDDLEAYFVLLDFKSAQCVRSASTDCSPSVDIYSDNKEASYISVLTDTNWEEEAHSNYAYSGTPKLTERKHYIVSNHDIFHEILAESFSENKISIEDPMYENVRSYFLLSKAQII